MGSYEYKTYDFVTPEEQRTGAPARHPVVIVGAGPVGLTAAVDLAYRGVRSVVLDDENQVSEGSRAICWAKRTLEIWDRLGCAEPMEAKGITWKLGKVFDGDRHLYTFDLLPEPHHKHPAFINLQQYYAEEYLIDRVNALDAVELRWSNRVTAVEPDADKVTLTIETPDGPYRTECDYLIACDGARSTVRKLMDLEFVGRYFEDRFLIADVKMKANFPTERWFWYHPPFHEGPSALLHRQADDVFRIDLQLGPEVDPDEEATPEKVVPRLKKMLGEDVEFELEWVSVYRFQARRLAKFRHGRVLFAGDSAHQVSPFGARGGNSGIPDAENLAWKLALVLGGKAPDDLLDSYDAERVYAADDNLRITSRTTDFMSAKGAVPVAFRDAALGLATKWPFARALVNAGRLSTATVHWDSPLNTPDGDDWAGGVVAGQVCEDAPVNGDDWLLDHLGRDFAFLYFFGAEAPVPDGLSGLARLEIPVQPLVVVPQGEGATAGGLTALADSEGCAFARYDARPGSCYLVRPDQTVAGRWRRFDEAAVRAALARASCRDAVAPAAPQEQAAEA
ncbi:MAG: FAD-dependent oxidoreductase [Alphaproteobacteria bacterium]|nr:FAD-dependent oxidoreductase [Alphaproteobacteria bacterium]